jgi:hypothetical protein
VEELGRGAIELVSPVPTDEVFSPALWVPNIETPQIRSIQSETIRPKSARKVF